MLHSQKNEEQIFLGVFVLFSNTNIYTFLNQDRPENAKWRDEVLYSWKWNKIEFIPKTRSFVFPLNEVCLTDSIFVLVSIIRFDQLNRKLDLHHCAFQCILINQSLDICTERQDENKVVFTG